MKFLNMLGLVTAADVAITASAANTAPATTLEVNGTPKGEAVELSASLETRTAVLLERTDGSFANTCTTSSLTGAMGSPVHRDQSHRQSQHQTSQLHRTSHR